MLPQLRDRVLSWGISRTAEGIQTFFVVHRCPALLKASSSSVIYTFERSARMHDTAQNLMFIKT